MGRSFAVCTSMASLGRIHIDIPYLGNRIDILTDSLIGVIRIPQNPFMENSDRISPIVSSLLCFCV